MMLYHLVLGYSVIFIFGNNEFIYSVACMVSEQRILVNSSYLRHNLIVQRLTTGLSLTGLDQSIPIIQDS